jgi:hypothetical protein
MGCTQSNNNIYIEKTDNIYIAKVFLNNKFRIICKSTDYLHVSIMIEKYNKDPGAFTFRYKDDLKNTYS